MYSWSQYVVGLLLAALFLVAAMVIVRRRWGRMRVADWFFVVGCLATLIVMTTGVLVTDSSSSSLLGGLFMSAVGILAAVSYPVSYLVLFAYLLREGRSGGPGDPGVRVERPIAAGRRYRHWVIPGVLTTVIILLVVYMGTKSNNRVDPEIIAGDVVSVDPVARSFRFRSPEFSGERGYSTHVSLWFGKRGGKYEGPMPECWATGGTFPRPAELAFVRIANTRGNGHSGNAPVLLWVRLDWSGCGSRLGCPNPDP